MNLSSYSAYIQFLPGFIEAFVFTFLITPFIGMIAQKNKVLDLPGPLRKDNDETASRRIHKVPKPLLGGAGVIGVFLIITFINVSLSTPYYYFIAGIMLLLILGVVDDIMQLNSKIQFLGQVAAALLVVLSGKGINFINNPFTKNIFFFNQGTVEVLNHTYFISSSIITIAWILLLINSVKWVAGTDGLVEGNSFIASSVLALLSVRVRTFTTASMGFIFSGALLGFLPFNFNPSKIFSGSSGKSVYGYILAVLAIISGGKLATAMLTLSIPILDAIYVIYTRIREKKPKSIFQLMAISDKNHLHHKLLNLGFSQKGVAITEYTITLILGIIALVFTGMHKALALFTAGCIILLSLFLITRTIKVRNKSYLRKQKDTPEKKYVY